MHGNRYENGRVCMFVARTKYSVSKFVFRFYGFGPFVADVLPFSGDARLSDALTSLFCSLYPSDFSSSVYPSTLPFTNNFYIYLMGYFRCFITFLIVVLLPCERSGYFFSIFMKYTFILVRI